MRIVGEAESFENSFNKELETEISLRSPYSSTYHEIADDHVVEVDVVDSLRQNLSRLRDLNGRMQFMMTEISGLMKI